MKKRMQKSFRAAALKTRIAWLRWSAERRTTTPVPASEAGNYAGSLQILLGQQPFMLQTLAAETKKQDQQEVG